VLGVVRFFQPPYPHQRARARGQLVGEAADRRGGDGGQLVWQENRARAACTAARRGRRRRGTASSRRCARRSAGAHPGMARGRSHGADRAPPPDPRPNAGAHQRTAAVPAPAGCSARDGPRSPTAGPRRPAGKSWRGPGGDFGWVAGQLRELGVGQQSRRQPRPVLRVNRLAATTLAQQPLLVQRIDHLLPCRWVGTPHALLASGVVAPSRCPHLLPRARTRRPTRPARRCRPGGCSVLAPPGL